MKIPYVGNAWQKLGIKQLFINPEKAAERKRFQEAWAAWGQGRQAQEGRPPHPGLVEKGSAARKKFQAGWDSWCKPRRRGGSQTEQPSQTGEETPGEEASASSEYHSARRDSSIFEETAPSEPMPNDSPGATLGALEQTAPSEPMPNDFPGATLGVFGEAFGDILRDEPEGVELDRKDGSDGADAEKAEGEASTNDGQEAHSKEKAGIATPDVNPPPSGAVDTDVDDEDADPNKEALSFYRLSKPNLAKFLDLPIADFLKSHEGLRPDERVSLGRKLVDFCRKNQRAVESKTPDEALRKTTLGAAIRHMHVPNYPFAKRGQHTLSRDTRRAIFATFGCDKSEQEHLVSPKAWRAGRPMAQRQRPQSDQRDSRQVANELGRKIIERYPAFRPVWDDFSAKNLQSVPTPLDDVLKKALKGLEADCQRLLSVARENEANLQGQGDTTKSDQIAIILGSLKHWIAQTENGNRLPADCTFAGDEVHKRAEELLNRDLSLPVNADRLSLKRLLELKADASEALTPKSRFDAGQGEVKKTRLKLQVMDWADKGLLSELTGIKIRKVDPHLRVRLEGQLRKAIEACASALIAECENIGSNLGPQAPLQSILETAQEVRAQASLLGHEKPVLNDLSALHRVLLRLDKELSARCPFHRTADGREDQFERSLVEALTEHSMDITDPNDFERSKADLESLLGAAEKTLFMKATPFADVFKSFRARVEGLPSKVDPRQLDEIKDAFETFKNRLRVTLDKGPMAHVRYIDFSSEKGARAQRDRMGADSRSDVTEQSSDSSGAFFLVDKGLSNGRSPTPRRTRLSARSRDGELSKSFPRATSKPAPADRPNGASLGTLSNLSGAPENSENLGWRDGRSPARSQSTERRPNGERALRSGLQQQSGVGPHPMDTASRESRATERPTGPRNPAADIALPQARTSHTSKGSRISIRRATSAPEAGGAPTRPRSGDSGQPLQGQTARGSSRIRPAASSVPASDAPRVVAPQGPTARSDSRKSGSKSVFQMEARIDPTHDDFRNPLFLGTTGGISEAIASLGEGEEVNDSVIRFAFNLLRERHGSKVAFLDPLTCTTLNGQRRLMSPQQLRELKNKDLLLLPIWAPGHWTLVALKPERGVDGEVVGCRANGYDTLGSGHYTAAQTIVLKLILKELGWNAKGRVFVARNTQNQGHNECGIEILRIAEYLALNPHTDDIPTQETLEGQTSLGTPIVRKHLTDDSLHSAAELRGILRKLLTDLRAEVARHG